MMFNRFIKLTMLTLIISTTAFADECCMQSVDFGIGWRRDHLDWNVSKMEESSVDAVTSSHIRFKDVQSYTAHGKARWAGSAFYIRLSADYGWTEKGRANQNFSISSDLLGGTLSTFVSDPVKRRSEVYDFVGAVGYPFTIDCGCRLMVVPVIGYSFHRQRLRVNEDDHSSSFSSDFTLSSTNPFFTSSSPDFITTTTSSSSSSSDTFAPFCTDSSDSPSNIAQLIGFSPLRHTDVYRFTWYGPFVGVDIAYALDPLWTLFTELEFHFLDRCNRKRKSYTAVCFVDDYHSKQWAYGFNGSIGSTISLCECWYTTIAVDFKWWKSDGNHDDLEWKSVGANISLGYVF